MLNIPIDNLYDWIANQFDDLIIYRFYPHGSKKLQDLNTVDHRYQSWPWLDFMRSINMICYDQEPLDFQRYQDLIPEQVRDLRPTVLPADNREIWQWHSQRNLLAGLSSTWDRAILLHSELNSPEVQRYRDLMVPAYWWSHALIARDWYRYAQWDQQLDHWPDVFPRDFNVYARDCSPPREYRQWFVAQLMSSLPQDRCRITVDPLSQDHQWHDPRWRCAAPQHLGSVPVPAHSSATYDRDHYGQCAFDVVLETVVEDQRQHLTEKTLRPLACGKPFFLVAGPGSLETLRGYGFRTWSPWIDESYDSIQDPQQRMIRVLLSMRAFAALDGQQRQQTIRAVHDIAAHNRRHFFSQEFSQQVTGEMVSNVRAAVLEIRRDHNQGGIWLSERRKLTSQQRRDILDNNPGRDQLTQEIMRDLRQQRRGGRA